MRKILVALLVLAILAWGTAAFGAEKGQPAFKKYGAVQMI